MTTREEIAAKESLDALIKKSRVHLYKPIQIAEILYHERFNIGNQIRLPELETYRTKSKKWRDEICNKFLGRSSSSSARFQDDLFNENAIPPRVLDTLGRINKGGNGIIEAYIYKKFQKKHSMMNAALEYASTSTAGNFNLDNFLDIFRREAGLKRSVDKIYEIIVHSLFSTLVEALEISIELTLNESKLKLLAAFEDFTNKILNISRLNPSIRIPAALYRVGVTNAADRGLDMYANFGLAIQIKHLSLSEELAENIVSSISADRIVIVCKDAEKNVIISLLNQIGWKSRIQSIITEKMLADWYEKALRGPFSDQLAPKLLASIRHEIQSEFPSTNNEDFELFLIERGYDLINNDFWIA